MGSTLKFLEWALSIIDDYFQQTGEIGIAEAVIFKAAKKHCIECKTDVDEKAKNAWDIWRKTVDTKHDCNISQEAFIAGWKHEKEN
jgi:hypothetical protein